MFTNSDTDKSVLFDAEDIAKNKKNAAFAYIIFFIPIFTSSESKYAMYHANQGLSLQLFGLLIYLFGWLMPFTGWIIEFLGDIILASLFAYGIYNSIKGKAIPLPVIGRFTFLK